MKRAFAMCGIVLLVLSVAVNSDTLCTNCFNTTATVTITNAKGILLQNAPMTCIFTNYANIPTDTPLRCGDTADSDIGNASNFTCNFIAPWYPAAKNYTVEGEWNATVQFTHTYGANGLTPRDSDINPTGETDSDILPPSGEIYQDCPFAGLYSPENCSQDPASGCYTGSEESEYIYLYNVSWDTNQTDCVQYGVQSGNPTHWFSNVNVSIIPFPAECTTTGCCCGTGELDNFFYYNTTTGVCNSCTNGVFGTNNSAGRICSMEYCTNMSTGWNYTVCTKAAASASPPYVNPGDSICEGSSVRFTCNYTDGDGNSIGGGPSGLDYPYVTIYTDLGTPNQVLHDNYNIHDILPAGDNTYYVDVSNLPSGMHTYGCNATKHNFMPAQSAPQNYNISQSMPSSLTITADHPEGINSGTWVIFFGNYTDVTRGLPITDANCTMTVNGQPYNAPYNSTNQSYNASTNLLFSGPNSVNFFCNRTCLQNGNTTISFYAAWSGQLSLPTLTLEDPSYAINSSGTYHRIVKSAPPNYGDRLVTTLAYGTFGANWTYAMIVKPNVDIPTCNNITPLVDSSKILFVRNSTLIANATSCSAITQFAGLIFEDDACISNASCEPLLQSMHMPFLFNLTNKTFYSNISSLTYVLLNGEQNLVQNISLLRDMYLNGYYLPSKAAPSFLMRLSGNFSPSPLGIYSFVDVNSFPRYGNLSSVDFDYFNGTIMPVYLIKGMPNCENATTCSSSSLPHFYLDNQIVNYTAGSSYPRLVLYGAEGIAINFTNPSCNPQCYSASDCNDNNPCTTDACVGASCNAQCAHTPITQNIDGDGCCLPGATYLQDKDCCNQFCTDTHTAQPNLCHVQCSGFAGCTNFISSCDTQLNTTTQCVVTGPPPYYNFTQCCNGASTSCGTNYTNPLCTHSTAWCNNSNTQNCSKDVVTSCAIPCSGGACTGCTTTCTQGTCTNCQSGQTCQNGQCVTLVCGGSTNGACPSGQKCCACTKICCLAACSMHVSPHSDSPGYAQTGGQLLFGPVDGGGCVCNNLGYKCVDGSTCDAAACGC